MKKIIILNGTGGCGKNAFQDFCGNYAPIRSISTVDKVKEAYTLLGWDGSKSEQHRRALSDIKDIGTKNLDHPFQYIKSEVEKFHASNDELMFIHSREPDEINRFVQSFGCITVLIRNSKVAPITTNHADRDVENFKYDYIVDNNGTLDDLDFMAWNFVEWLKEGGL